MLFNPGDSLDLAAQIDSVWDAPEDARLLGAAARANYERVYSADQNLKDLLAIYEQAAVRRMP